MRRRSLPSAGLRAALIERECEQVDRCVPWHGRGDYLARLEAGDSVEMYGWQIAADAGDEWATISRVRVESDGTLTRVTE